MNNKFYQKIALLGGLALLCTACGGSKPTEGPVTVNFFGWGKPAEQRNFQTMINKFMEINPDIKVVYDCVDPTNYDLALQNRLKSLPDVFYMPDYSFLKYVNSGRLMDISSYITEEERSKVWPVVIDMYQYDRTTKTLGKGPALYGISKDLGPYNLVYNKTLIKEIYESKGLEPVYPSATTPMNWEEYVSYLDGLKYTKNKETIWGVGSYEIMHAVYSNNADFWTDDVKTSRITEKNFIDAVQWISDLSNVYGVAPTYTAMKGSTAYTKFLNQQCLMTFMGPWDMSAFWDEVKFEYDIMPTPVGMAEGAKSTSWIGSVALSLRTFKESEKAKMDAAVKLTKFLTLDPITARMNYEIGQAQPNVIDIATNEWVNNVGLEGKHLLPQSKQVWLDVTAANNDIRYHNRAKYYLYAVELYDDLVGDISSAVNTGTKTAKEFLESQNEAFQKALDDNANYIK